MIISNVVCETMGHPFRRIAGEAHNRPGCGMNYHLTHTLWNCVRVVAKFGDVLVVSATHAGPPIILGGTDEDYFQLLGWSVTIVSEVLGYFGIIVDDGISQFGNASLILDSLGEINFHLNFAWGN